MIAAGLYAALALFVAVIAARVIRDVTKPLPPHRKPEPTNLHSKSES